MSARVSDDPPELISLQDMQLRFTGPNVLSDKAVIVVIAEGMYKRARDGWHLVGATNTND